MAVSLANIRINMKMREKSDRQMGFAWILVYLFPIGVFVITASYTFVSLLKFFSSIDFTTPQLYSYSFGPFPKEFALIWLTVGLTSLANFVTSTVSIYLLVNRRSTHFKRQKSLSESIIAAVNSLAKTKRVDEEMRVLAERSTEEVNSEESEKSAILWAVLSALVPFLQLYVYYFLFKDFYIHEQREDDFWVDMNGTLNKLGVDFSVTQRIEPIPYRSFVLYLIMTIVTVGLFIVYWFFVMLKDPNEHFKYHIEVENYLLAALESVVV